MFQFKAKLESVFDDAQTDLKHRWSCVNWIDKVLLTAPSVQPIYWHPDHTHVAGWGKCRPIPGLPDRHGYDGITVIAGKVILWRGTTFKWSDSNDFAQWIPVRTTASTGRALVATTFTRPSPTSTTDWVYLSEASGSFVPNQFIRVVSHEDIPDRISYSYYTVSEVATAGEASSTVNFEITVPAGGTARVYLREYVDWRLGSRLTINGQISQLTVTASSHPGDVTYRLAKMAGPIPAVHGFAKFFVTPYPEALQIGDIVSVGHRDEPGQDLYRVEQVGNTLVTVRLGLGEAQAGLGGYYHYGLGQAPVYVRHQHWIDVTNEGSDSVVVPKNASMASAHGIKLTSLDLTSTVETGDSIPVGAVVETVDSNEAGEAENVGNEVNGPIYQIIPLSDYGYIFKRESIQSLQYVGTAAGIWYPRAEILGEGLIGRYAICRYANDAVAFWGHKGWYLYQGGRNLSEIGRAHWDEVNAEFDSSRADEVVAFHNRSANEIWFTYPVVGSATTKVVIYNYTSGSVVVDEYDEKVNGITAIGAVEWDPSPTWESLSPDVRINGPAKRWYEDVDEGPRSWTIIGIGGDEANPALGEDPQTTVPRMLLHGRVFYRASRDDCRPEPYLSAAETPDFDGGDPENVKTFDGVYLHLHVPKHLPRPMRLKVQMGLRDALDADIRWTEPAHVDVSGNGNIQTKVNMRGAGRLVRLRFFSDELDVRWIISAYIIHMTPGTTY